MPWNPFRTVKPALTGPSMTTHPYIGRLYEISCEESPTSSPSHKKNLFRKNRRLSLRATRTSPGLLSLHTTSEGAPYPRTHLSPPSNSAGLFDSTRRSRLFTPPIRVFRKARKHEQQYRCGALHDNPPPAPSSSVKPAKGRNSRPQRASPSRAHTHQWQTL